MGHATNSKKILSKTFKLINLSILFMIFISLLTTRLVNIENPNIVSWDEAHFGKYINYYIKNQFFLDVHPPLGKMILSTIAKLGGYDGSFEFKNAGDEYNSDHYIIIRKFNACIGIVSALVIGLITHEITNKSIPTMIYAISLITFDTASLTISRFILLDQMLIMAILLTFLFFIKSIKQVDLSYHNIMYSILTGSFLAVSMSIKFVGFFTLMFIGIVCLIKMITSMADSENTMFSIFKISLMKIFTLLILPLSIYTIIFYISFSVASRSGPDDNFFDSQFQIGIDGSRIHSKLRAPEFIANGSIVSIRNCNINGVYLHSHNYLNPVYRDNKIQQQQITGYNFRDSNNYWKIHLVRSDSDEKINKANDEFIRNEDEIILVHLNTKRKLHSHDKRAYGNKEVYQVTGYGNDEIGDTNDHWIIKYNNSKDDKLSPISTRFRLMHSNLLCELMNSESHLDDWGFGQIEIYCNVFKKHKNSCWYIEEHSNRNYRSIDLKEKLEMNFIRKFIYIHMVMFEVNSSFKPKSHEITSRPIDWILDLKGIWFSGMNNHRVYLLGNPLLWWTNLFFIVLTPVYLVLSYVYHARNKKLEKFDWNLLLVFFFWICNYLPYFFMGRVLYFHHYLPAYYISSIIAAYMIELSAGEIVKFCKISSIHMKIYIQIAIIAIIVSSFFTFSFLSFGMRGNIASTSDESNYTNYRWLETWEF